MTKFCPECGTKQRDDNNRYCSNCGFDFSKLEGADSRSDDIRINIPISSDSDNSVVGSGSEKSDNSVVGSSGSISGSIGSDSKTTSSISNNSPSSSNQKSSNANTRAKINNNSRTNTKTQSDEGFLSNLTFNKVFIPCAVLFIILFIIGMVSMSMDTEPSSDNGLTSFMESSDYDVPDFLQDYDDSNDNSYDSDSYDYLNYND